MKGEVKLGPDYVRFLNCGKDLGVYFQCVGKTLEDWPSVAYLVYSFEGLLLMPCGEIFKAFHSKE